MILLDKWAFSCYTLYRKMKYSKGDLIVVFWYDTVNENSWTALVLAEREEPPLAKTVGWFINEDEKCIRLAGSVVGDEVGYEVIPRGMVRDIELVRQDELEVPEKE